VGAVAVREGRARARGSGRQEKESAKIPKCIEEEREWKNLQEGKKREREQDRKEGQGTRG
jgi:hypothetical protein